MNIMYRQRTLKGIVECAGIGLHSGRKVTLKIKPAPVDTGIIFVRTDLPGSSPVKATVENVVDTSYATTIGKEDVTISTIEHLMASFAGLGIDNAFVEVDAAEIPIMDGSAAPFLFLLKSGGIRIQNTSKRFLVVRKTMEVKTAYGYARLSPAKEFKLACEIDFSHPMLKKQSFDMSFSDTVFEKELSRARTFGFLKDVESMREKGLIKGGSLDSAIVIDDFRVVNPEGLRYDDEFVRHKVLDAIGDLSLLGMPIIGAIEMYKPGHSLNCELARTVLDTPKAWKMVKVSDRELERLDIKIPQFQQREPSMAPSMGNHLLVH